MRRLDPAGWRSPAALLGTAVVVGGLVSAAFATVLGAGCDDPGTLVARNGVLVLQNGCVSSKDLVAPGTPVTSTDLGSARP